MTPPAFANPSAEPQANSPSGSQVGASLSGGPDGVSNVAAVAAESTAVLDANLRALSRTDPELAERIRQTEPAALQWGESKAGPLTALLASEAANNGEPSGQPARPLQLASRYDPMAEADKLIGEVDFAEHACIVVLGMGLGYHVHRIVEQMSDGVLIVFEPDVSVLRAVLERIDHTSWLGQPHALLADDTIDRGRLLHRLDKFAGVITQGAVLVTHPPTRQRRGEELKRMSQLFTELLGFCRTNVATALVNAARTVENLTSNIAYYAAGANTNALHNATTGYPAVCVSAGPSLARNIHLLRDPATRKNVVVICVQTALKVLLKHGITPDFVTALDYADISRRFYEGLPRLEGVTLVAEPKAHPGIFESFPGPVRVDNSGFLDRMLGPLAPKLIPLKDGATVAHLSFYLAQHLGCDPIMMLGQDLGFSDGLYYMPGTAIHDVWDVETNAFNTLEMMEWQRIVRHRGHLRKIEDVHGRTIYTDEQMATYLKQFERDFATATQRVLDCTEGGAVKQGAEVVPLADALQRFATREVPRWPMPELGFDPDRLRAAIKHMEGRLAEAIELRQVSVRATPILENLVKHHRDKQRGAQLFGELTKLQKRIEELQDMFDLVNQLNTIGTFKRARSDRRIAVATHADAYAKQDDRLQRDLENVHWLTQSCDEAIRILEAACERLREHQRSQTG